VGHNQQKDFFFQLTQQIHRSLNSFVVAVCKFANSQAHKLTLQRSF